MTKPEDWGGSLTLRPGAVYYSGPGGNAARHHHHAIQLIKSHSGYFTLTFEDQSVKARAAIIPGGVRHGFEAHSPIELALVEPEGPTGMALQEIAAELGGRDLGSRIPKDAKDAPRVIASLLRGQEVGTPHSSSLSPAVNTALTYIEEALGGRPLLDEAAAAAHISPSRLTHLFTAEMGIPFSRYVLWARLRRMVELVGDGNNLTQAAHGAGFSDSAHLSRVFRENFGLPPSSLLQMKLTGRW